MNKSTRFVIIVCTVSIALVLLLQFYWIKNYYAVNRATFEKEANLAFEDALKKEFSLRCDTVEHLIALRLLDTTEFRITSALNAKTDINEYTISNAHNPHDKFMASTFSLKRLNKPILPGDTTVKKQVADLFAYNLRSENLETHVVYYLTQNLGNFITFNVQKYDFDTNNLRPVLKRYLLKRDITVPFKFYVADFDSTYNATYFSRDLLAKFPIITKSFPTYSQKHKQQFVRAMFVNPSGYIVERMGWVFAGSLLLVAMVAFSLIYLLKSLFNEQRLSAIKNDFISNITHEFKTPIATASAAIEAITDFDVLNDPEKARRYLNHSKNELARLSVLVDKVLNISLYENQQFAIKPEPVNVDETIKAILQQFSLTGKNVKWSYTNNTGINSINADKLYFGHAISNIIDNAIKYSGNEVNINVDCTVRDGLFVIAVRDNGIGISRQDLPFVFEKFYRASSGNKHSVKGHGLGLNYVKNIVERHKGWCKMESDFGKGSTLILAWPV